MQPLKIFLIAGEVSGDKLGASLIRALRKEFKGKITFCGVGDNLMFAEGVNSIFPMEQISLMGFLEVLPHIFRVLKLIAQTVESIRQFKPDLVITIDSPGFSMRVVKKLNRDQTKIIHYVAPSVWAYKPQRAVYMHKYYDLVLALLPFEPPYFTRVGLKCEFVGHPIIEDDWQGVSSDIFRKKYNISKNTLVFGVMCGSRKGEIRQMLPVFTRAIKLLALQKKAVWVFPTVSDDLADEIKKIVSMLDIHFVIPVNEPQKISMLKSFDFAIVKSGTGSLEVALAGVPMVVAYKINKITAFILRHVYKFRSFASIVNVLANEQVIPEFLQEDCIPKKLANGLQKLINGAGTKQVRRCKKILKQLELADGTLPSIQAAREVIKTIL